MNMLYRRVIKRALDLLAAVFLLIVLSPFYLVTAILVRCKLGSPILFKQERPGLHGRIFTLIKFRTMKDAYDSEGKPLPDSERLSSFGLRLRSTSLDELPELLNVLRGQMSLVGPRPLLVGYLPLYSPRQARRHEVRPGVTGWAQVSGRNALSWEEKFELDVWYVEHQSFLLDLRILMRTVATVFSQGGVQGAGEATAAPFEG